MTIRHYIFLLLFIPMVLGAQVGTSHDEAIDRLVDDPVFSHALLAVSVWDMQNDSELYSHQSDVKLIPASSLKLVTNFSALHYFGKEYRFETGIYHSGQLKYDGTLTGDLIVQASGDPTLGSFEFKGVRDAEALVSHIVEKIKAFGIRCIEGRILLDDSIFSNSGPGDSWQWNDVANYYGSGAWSMNFHENLFHVYFDTKGPLGSKARLLGIEPAVGGVQIKSDVRIADTHTGDRAYAFGGPGIYNIRVEGTLPAGRTSYQIKAALPDPGLFFLQELKQGLSSEGISTGACLKMKIEQMKGMTYIFSVLSPSLDRIIYTGNLESNNMYSEALLKLLGNLKKDADEIEYGIQMIDKYLDKLHLDSDEIAMADGCGMSRQNYITARLMAGFLSGCAAEFGRPLLLKLMPEPGNKGTLEYLFQNRRCRNSIWIKTGSMSSIQSYSGVLKTKKGKWFSFCLMANGFNGSNARVRNSFESFLDTIYENN